MNGALATDSLSRGATWTIFPEPIGAVINAKGLLLVHSSTIIYRFAAIGHTFENSLGMAGPENTCSLVLHTCDFGPSNYAWPPVI